jgi:TonB-linked SusC/RagA family outer membrane protein
MRKIVSILTLLLFTSVVAWSQGKITGTVKDQNGDPVPFATVTVKGTKVSVAADANANFTIPAKSGDVLTISAVGIQPMDVPVGNAPVIPITVTRVSGTMTDVVVTTALGVQRQAKSLGYATTTINNKDLTTGKSVNIQQALNGKISGLNISTVNSGVFENAKINIRGIRSLTGNNQPMLVVDGAPTPLGYLSSIPPSDVASLTVLKSSASAAIYGPDAVNGVIVITTKRGGKNPTVTISTTVQATNVSYFPKIQKDFGQGAGEVVDQYGNYGYVPYENQQYGPKFDGVIRPLGVTLEDGSIQMVPYSNDHYKDKIKFWNTGLTWQNSASIAGQDFYVSIDDAKINGLVPDDENHRTSLRFNGGKTYGNFQINYGLNYTLQNYDVVNEAGFQNSFPNAYDGGLFFLVMQTANNVPLLNYKDWQNSKFAQFSNYYNEYAVNPYWLIGNIRTKGREDDLLGNIDISYKFYPWLKATARLSSSLAFANYKNTNAPIVVTDWAAENRNATQYSNRPGSVFDDENSASRINLDYFLSGQTTAAKDLTLNYIAGGMVRDNAWKDVALGGNNLVVPYLYNVAVRSGDAFVPVFNGSTASNNYNVQSRLVSAYGTVSLNYEGWLYGELTGRNDWDSRLSKENRSFFYPSANVSVILSQIVPALKNSNLLNYVKVRGAVSKSGNVNLNPYALNATYSTTAGFPYGNIAGFTANNTVPDPNLKPEFVNTVEAGIEVGMRQNHINFNATYFNQKNTNQVLAIAQSGTTGYTTKLANAADFKNYGVEMELNLTPLINIGKGRIDFKVNATYNNNEVTRTLGNVPVVLAGSAGFIQNSVSSPTVANIAMVGGPAFQFQLTDYNRDPATGKVIIDPVTGYPSEAAGQVIKGRSLPLWIVGMTPSYSIGSFTITMTWDYKGGNDFFSGLGSDEDFAGISERSAAYGRQRFVFPNSVYWDGSKYVNNTSILVQDGNYNFWANGNTNTAVATNYFASASAWRLRELNISYVLPAKWFGNKNIIKSVTVAAVGKNLLLFVPKSNQWGDPEFNYSTTGNTFGIASSFQSPASRLFGGSLTVQF